MNKGILISLLLNICIIFNVSALDFFFRPILKSKEIRNAFIYDVLQDSKGFVWIGTSKGLFRTDGKTLTHQNSIDTLFNHPVSTLFEDSHHNIWIGFRNGQISRISGHAIMQFIPEEGFPKVPISDIIEDEKGIIWFSTLGEGLYYFKSNRLYNLNIDDGLTDNYCYCLEKVSNSIWTGTDAGISICSSGTVTSTLTELPDIMVTAIKMAENGDIWIGFHERGVFRFNPNTRGFEVLEGLENWTQGSVNSIRISENTLIAAVQSGGILVYELEYHSMPVYDFYKPNQENRMIGAMIDKEGNIWANTGSQIYLSNGLSLRFAKHNLGSVQAICSGEDKTVWFATAKGLFSFITGGSAKGSIRKYQLLPNFAYNKTTSLFQDKYGKLWIGTLGDGLMIMDIKTGKVVNYKEKDGLINNNILSIAGKDKEVWLATLGGASVVKDIASKKLLFVNYNQNNGLINNFIYSVFADQKGHIWFGTDGRGISGFDGQKFIGYNADNGLTDLVIYSITGTSNGKLWCSSSDNNIFEFDGYKFSKLIYPNNFPDEDITSLIADKSNQLLIIRDNSFSVYNFEKKTIEDFSTESGVNAIKSGLNAVTIDEEGSVWIGCSDEIIRYTALAADFQKVPLSVIENVLVFLNPLPDRSENNFRSTENHISFEIAGIWFTNPESVNFRYMLEGYDINWLTGQGRIVSYSNLPPGKYKFRLESSSGGLFSDLNEVSYSFTIKNPVWKTWWFIGFVFLIIGIGFLLIMRLRERKLERLSELKKEQIRFQFETLKSQINPHFLFNSFSTLMGIIEEDQSTALVYVEKLSAFFRNILEYRDKELISLREELDLLDNYIFIVRQRYPENLEVIKNFDHDTLDSLIPPLTLQLLVENAIKHNVISSSKPLHINLLSDQNYIVVYNTIQLKTSNIIKSTGFGLQSIKKRYEVICGNEPIVKSDAASFSVLLPIIRKY